MTSTVVRGENTYTQHKSVDQEHAWSCQTHFSQLPTMGTRTTRDKIEVGGKIDHHISHVPIIQNISQNSKTKFLHLIIKFLIVNIQINA